MKTTPLHIRRFSYSAAIIWTVIVLGSFFWFYYQQGKTLLEIAKAEARIAFQKDTLYRKWAAKHGGVYVPVTQETQPNPYLINIPERDISTPSAKQLTLINPAYMTRQVFELADREANFVKGHITSLKPIRAENAPDEWEKQALSAFEGGSKEHSSVELLNGQQYMRLMRPFIAEQPCLKCHAAQGYKLGDIRGGISVSVPMNIYSHQTNSNLQVAGATHSIIWLLGIGMITFTSRSMKKHYLLIHEKNIQLENEIQEREIAQEQLQDQTTILEEEISEHQQTHEKLIEHTNQLESEAIARKQVEDTLNGLITLNNQILDCSKVGIIVYDRELKYLVWNKYMEELTGMSSAVVLGKHPQDIFPFIEREGVLKRLQLVLDGQPVERLEFPFTVIQTGNSGFAADVSSPLLNESGEIIGVIGMVQDVSHQKTLEAQLRQSQKMEALGQLAGGVAHDFNNILSVILGYSNLLSMHDNLDKVQLEYVGHISESSERAAQLTKGLLAFSRKQVLSPRIVEMNELLQHVQKFLLRIIGEDIQLNLIPGVDKLMVQVDAGQIEQVLVNLATNARDAMKQGGVLTIETSYQHIDVSTDDCALGDYACISVSDTGIGMSRDTISKIFEPFFTTKEVGKGTGLGMAIVFGIVKQHQGFIKCYSELGYGTTFKVYIPLTDSTVMELKYPQKVIEPKRGNETILVAEDDSNVRNLTTTVLSNFGYQVIEAIDGEDLIEKFTENHEKIHLVLTDVIMPKINGKEAIDQIRKIRSDVRVLFSSGYTAEFMAGKGINDIEVDFISKPVQPLQLLQKIREILDR